MRRLILLASAACAMSSAALVVFPAPPAFALGLGISTPSVTLANFGPGLTATGSGTLVVSGVLTPWTLKAADTTGHAGHLVPGAVGCSGSAPQTANALRASASGLIGTTQGTGTVTIGAAAVTVATGVVADTVEMSYSLGIGKTETMRAGCVYSTTITYTVQ